MRVILTTSFQFSGIPPLVPLLTIFFPSDMDLTNWRIKMLKSISNAISATFRTIEKTANVVEHTVDLADREVQLLEKRQDKRMKEILKELETI